jgi:hypothetical protein
LIWPQDYRALHVEELGEITLGEVTLGAIVNDCDCDGARECRAHPLGTELRVAANRQRSGASTGHSPVWIALAPLAPFTTDIGVRWR